MTLLIMESKRSSCLSLSSRHQFPASLRNYSNRLITSSHRKQGSPGLLILQRLLLIALFSSATPVRPCVTQCPPSPGCEYMWLINCCLSSLSSVACPVFNHPHIPSTGNPPSPLDEKQANRISGSEVITNIYSSRNVNSSLNPGKHNRSLYLLSRRDFCLSLFSSSPRVEDKLYAHSLHFYRECFLLSATEVGGVGLQQPLSFCELPNLTFGATQACGSFPVPYTWDLLTPSRLFLSPCLLIT